MPQLSLMEQFYNLILENEGARNELGSRSIDDFPNEPVAIAWNRLEQVLGKTMPEQEVWDWKIAQWKEQENQEFATEYAGVLPNTKAGRMKILQDFSRCSNGLEPEVLSEDMGALQSDYLHKLTTYEQRWANLEELLGRKVTEQEIWESEAYVDEDYPSSRPHRDIVQEFHSIIKTGDNYDNSQEFISVAQRSIQYGELAKRWSDLEDLVGHKVTTEEALGWVRELEDNLTYRTKNSYMPLPPPLENLQPCPLNFKPPQDMVQKFENLLMWVSPDKISQTGVADNEVEKDMFRQWQKLEQEIGYRVTEKDVTQWEVPKTIPKKLTPFKLKR